MSKLSFFKKSKDICTGAEQDILIELDDDEIDSVKAVGNSVESAKWLLRDDMNYLINKKIY